MLSISMTNIYVLVLKYTITKVELRHSFRESNKIRFIQLSFTVGNSHCCHKLFLHLCKFTCMYTESVAIALLHMDECIKGLYEFPIFTGGYGFSGSMIDPG